MSIWKSVIIKYKSLVICLVNKTIHLKGRITYYDIPAFPCYIILNLVHIGEYFNKQGWQHIIKRSSTKRTVS